MTKETLAYENIDREFKELYVSDIKKTVVAFANMICTQFSGHRLKIE